ncbi:MAG: hypothetical protein JWR01_1612 [Subtercola sp.]|nr:hypothetical protein [Subtercola sp.]
MTAEPTPIELVRANHGLSRDPRVFRTRAKILDAVHALVARHEPSISVPDIVREAGISKTSFYHHFASLDEIALLLVEQAYVDSGRVSRAAHASDELSYAETTRAYYRRLVEHYVEHREFYRSVVTLRLSRDVHTHAVRAMAADIEPDVAGNPYRPPSVRPYLAASFIASAVVGFLDEWIEGDFDATSDELLEGLLQLLPPWFTRGREGLAPE